MTSNQFRNVCLKNPTVQSQADLVAHLNLDKRFSLRRNQLNNGHGTRLQALIVSSDDNQ